MRFKIGARWQAALVVLLFLGSLAALGVSSVMAFVQPGEELHVRDQAAAAAARLAEQGVPLLNDYAPSAGGPPPSFQQRCRTIADQVLSAEPGAEGGFYLADDVNQFVGGGSPGGPHPPPDDHRPPPHGDHDHPPGRDGPPSNWDRPPPFGPGGPPPFGHDGPPGGPPPREAPYIRQQIQDCLTRPPANGPLVQTFDVSPNRIVVGTAALGDQRPARAAAWVMIRLDSPEHQRAQLARTQTAVGLALGGILLSLLLTANLGWTLWRERRGREKLADDLRRSEHLASLGRLLAGVAHEVRNPLAGIRSTVQLWERLPHQARTPESLDAVIRAVDRLNGLVSRLLYFARTGWEQARPVDMNAVVRQTLELVRAQAAAQCVELHADLQADLPSVAGSHEALQQVVLNLAANALQAMPKGGRLDMRTRALDDPKEVELRVADSGPGVSPEARAHLFEPFHSTRPEGTGLGLALCREIVRQHHGEIDLDDADDSGAVFVVRLSAHNAEGKTS
ncbi:MAG TPA: ATP-binding protein [Gemmataceae bacterium]|nr:ATP-binding protein [Gemmataceae bacterium]